MIQWRKSSHSQGGGQGECVEVSTNSIETTFIRDSRDPSGPRIALGRGEFAAMLGRIKRG